MKARWEMRQAVVAFTVAICAAVGGLCAAEPELVFSETRTYDVFVDGRKSGQSRLTIASYRDGTETVKADAKITVSFVVFNYIYEFHGQEQWRSGRLEQLASNAVDGGQKMSLKVERADGGYRITNNKGQPDTAPEIHFTTNYWRQPPVNAPGQPLVVLDADTGVRYEIKIESLDKREFTVAGQPVMASGFRLQGKLDAELWFDQQGLLVHQTGKEDGHPTEVRLASIQRPAQTAAK